MTEIIALCPQSWELYDAFIVLLNSTPPDSDKIQVARNEYINHRETCPLCSPMTTIRPAGKR
jgi:hypothetical protein